MLLSLCIAMALEFTPSELHSFRFSGGNELDLAKELAKQTGQPCVVLAAPGRTWKAQKFDWIERKDLVRLAGTVLQCRVGPQGGLSTTAWPRSFGDVTFYSVGSQSFSTPKIKDDFEDGKLTLETGAGAARGSEEPVSFGEALTMDDIAGLHLSKPLKWQRYLNRARFKISVKGVNELSFLKAVADSAGAKLKVEANSYEIVVDPQTWRKGSVAMWQIVQASAQKRGDRLEGADAAYMLALLSATEDWIFESAFREPEKSWARTWYPGSRIHALAWQRARVMLANPQCSPRPIFQRVADSEGGVDGYIEDNGCARAGYMNKSKTEVYIM